MRLSIGLTTYYGIDIIKFKRMIRSLVADFTTTDIMTNNIRDKDDLDVFLARLDSDTFNCIPSVTNSSSDACVEVMVIVDSYDPSKGTHEQHKEYDKTIEQIKDIVNSMHVNGVTFTTYVTKGNNRVSANRNYCIAKAKGKWIKFVDDDDISCNINELLRAINEGDKYDKNYILMYILYKRILSQPSLPINNTVSFIARTDFLRANKLYFDIDIMGEDYLFRLKLHDIVSKCIVVPIMSYIVLDKGYNNNSQISNATFAMRAGIYDDEALDYKVCVKELTRYVKYHYDVNDNTPINLSGRRLHHMASFITSISTLSYMRKVMLKYDYMFGDKALISAMKQLNASCRQLSLSFTDVLNVCKQRSDLHQQFVENMLSAWHMVIPFDKIYDYATYLKQLIDRHNNISVLDKYLDNAERVKMISTEDANTKSMKNPVYIDNTLYCLIICIMQNAPLYELYSDFDDISYSLLDDFTKRYVLVKAACGDHIALSCISNNSTIKNTLSSIYNILKVDQRKIDVLDIMKYGMKYIRRYTRTYGIFAHPFYRLLGVLDASQKFIHDSLMYAFKRYVKQYYKDHDKELLACIPDNTSNDMSNVINYKEDAKNTLKKYTVKDATTMDDVYVLSKGITARVISSLASDIELRFRHNTGIDDWTFGDDVDIHSTTMLMHIALMIAPEVVVDERLYDDITPIDIHRKMTIVNTTTGTTDVLPCMPFINTSQKNPIGITGGAITSTNNCTQWNVIAITILLLITIIIVFICVCVNIVATVTINDYSLNYV